MAHATPRVQDGILEQSILESMSHKIIVNSRTWYEWLEQSHVFYFKNGEASFTARKPQEYWYAYKRSKGKLNGVYIGKTETMTLERLNEVAHKLAQATQATQTKVTDTELSSDLKALLNFPVGDCPLLVTKFYAPPVHPRSVSRARLVERLNEGIDHKLALILAPAGFGKTTLLSEWISHSPFAVAWLSLDQCDNDIRRFFCYFMAALKTISSEIKDRTTSLLYSTSLPPLEVVMTTLINEIATIVNPCILVLDNFHTIHTKYIHQGISFLLNHLPPHFHLVIATREEPPLLLTRLRSDNELFELRREDLCFTAEETSLFFSQTQRFDLSSESIAALEQRAGGWVMGLQLIALSLQKWQNTLEHAILVKYLHSKLPNETYLLDYLTNEILAHLPRKTQQFLLQTSLLTSFTEDLCNAVTATTSGHDILAQLERKNGLITHIDQYQDWFHYHPLFADLLSTYLQRTQANTIPLLHQRAARWYEEHQMMREAIEHALAARDYEYTACLVEKIGQTLLMNGEVAALTRWLKPLPLALISAHLKLYLIYIWTLLTMAQFEATDTHLSIVEQLLTNAQPLDIENLLQQVSVIKAISIFNAGYIDSSIHLSNNTLLSIKDKNNFLSGILEMNVGDAHAFAGNVKEAMQSYHQAIVTNQANGNRIAIVITMSSMGKLKASQGHLQQAVSIYEKAIQLATIPDGIQPFAGKAYILLGVILYEWNRLDDAFCSITEGITLCKQWGHRELLAEGYLLLTYVKQAQGNLEAAQETCQEAERILFDTPDGALFKETCKKNLKLMRISEQVTLIRAWLKMLQGEMSVAIKWLQEGCDITEGELIHLPCSCIAMIMAWLHQGYTDEALQWLETHLQIAEAGEWTGYTIDMLTLKAICIQAQGNPDSAAITLAHALSLAEPANYTRTFLDKGTMIVPLLRHVHVHNAMPDYTNKLLAHIKGTEDRQISNTNHDDQVLSRRELEVLQLLAQGLSNHEVAQKLVLAPGTVKKHVENIYSKLYVNKRTQAILRAREAHLL